MGGGGGCLALGNYLAALSHGPDTFAPDSLFIFEPWCLCSHADIFHSVQAQDHGPKIEWPRKRVSFAEFHKIMRFKIKKLAKRNPPWTHLLSHFFHCGWTETYRTMKQNSEEQPLQQFSNQPTITNQHSSVFEQFPSLWQPLNASTLHQVLR